MNITGAVKIRNESSEPAEVTLSTALDKDLDSVDVGKVSNGGVTTALNAVVATTTSAEIEVGAAGYKHVLIELLGASFASGNFVVSLTGCAITGGTFGAINRCQDAGTYAAVGNMTISTNVAVSYVIENIGVNFLKVTGTRTTDGTLTVKVIPFN